MANGSPTAAIVSISVGASTEDFSQLLLTKLAPLWQPRHLLAVVDGLCYQVGDFRIRVGEVKQGIGSSQLVRGVAIELAFMNPDEGGLESCDGATQMIMTFWEELSLTGAKEFFSDREDDGFQDVRLWCRMLTLRN